MILGGDIGGTKTRLAFFSRPRVLAVLSLVGIAVATTSTAIWRASLVPRHQGQTVRDWLLLLDSRASRAGDYQRAADALVQMGAPAVPELARVLRRKPRSLQEQSRNLAVRLHLMKSERLPIEEEQARAARAAHILAEHAKVDIESLIPSLSYHLTNANYGDPENAHALALAGSKGVAVLTNLLAQGDLHARGQSAWALHLVHSHPGVVDALIHAATDPDRSVRVRALFSLPRGGVSTDRIVPLGLGLLSSLDPVERWAAASLLQDYTAFFGVAGALRDAENDLDDRVRSVAKAALKETSSSDPDSQGEE